MLSESRETPNGKTVRLAKEQKITDYHGGGDTYHSDQELDSYPYDKLRPELSAGQMIKSFPRLARFFRKELEQRAGFETVEIEAVR